MSFINVEATIDYGTHCPCGDICIKCLVCQAVYHVVGPHYTPLEVINYSQIKDTMDGMADYDGRTHRICSQFEPIHYNWLVDKFGVAQ